MRRQLFATGDVMAHLGHAAPTSDPAPLQAAVDPWDPKAAEAALSDAAKTKRQRQTEEQHRNYEEAREAGNRRVATHRPSARLREVLWTARTYAQYETDATEALFRVYLYFQPRFRTEGGPAVVPIPRAGPEWTSLETDAEMRAMIAEITEVMVDHDRKRVTERQAKKRKPPG